MKQLYERLEEYSHSDFYPFHMPGHKRIPLFDKSYSIDITEIEGFDDLHHPEGILHESMEQAAQWYGADQSFFLVNGSTSGILAAISAVTNIGDTIAAARNCHKSVYHAMVLRNLKGVYVYPEMTGVLNISGGLNPSCVEQALLGCPDAKAFVMVSPTYEGVVSDIESIAQVVHSHKIPLIVDEAHGAHFRFHDVFPVSALELGADIVIQSLHKTLPSMTQTAILHWKSQPWNAGQELLPRRLKQYLSIYQTSSPSYVLMASMEQGIEWMKQERSGRVQEYVENLSWLRETFQYLRHIRLLEPADCNACPGKPGQGEQRVWYDISKIVFGTAWKAYSGKWLYERLLEQYHLQMEMCTPDYCIAMTSALDTREGFHRLIKALQELDQIIEDGLKRGDAFQDSMSQKRAVFSPVPGAKACMNWYEAMNCSKKIYRLRESAGEIAGEPIYLYPPGIPVIVPGEQITEEMVDLICHYRQEGFSLKGMADGSGEYISVIEEHKGENDGENILPDGKECFRKGYNF